MIFIAMNKNYITLRSYYKGFIACFLEHLKTVGRCACILNKAVQGSRKKRHGNEWNGNQGKGKEEEADKEEDGGMT